MVKRVELGHVFASSAHSSEARGVKIWEFRYAARQKVPRHQHDQAYFAFLLRGDLIETEGKDSSAYSADRIQYLPRGCVHSGVAGPEGALFVGFEIDDDFKGSFDADFSLPRRGVKLRSQSAAMVLHRAYLEAMKSVAGLCAIDWPLELTASLIEGIDDRDCTWLRQLSEYINDCYPFPLAIDDLAELVGRHPAHVMRAFREKKGSTIGAYIQQVRLDAAIRQLTGGRDSIASVAAQCGFADQSHLTRVLRRELGITPAVLRKLYEG